MLMQFFCQAIGTLVLISLAATLLLYVSFKRHQKHRKDTLTDIAAYGSVFVSMIFLFSTYFKSVEFRFNTNNQTPEFRIEMLNTMDSMGREIIDMRPLYHCDSNTDLSWKPACVLRSLEQNAAFKNNLNDFVSYSISESEEL